MSHASHITISRELGRFASLTDALLEKGYTIHYPVLRSGIIESNKFSSKMLQVPLATKLYEYEKIRVVDDVPMSLEHVLIPWELVPGIEQVKLDDTALYTYLYETYGLLTQHDQEEVLIVHASEREAKLLRLDANAEVMMIEGVSLLASGVPFAYFKIISRPEFFNFRSDVYYE